MTSKKSNDVLFWTTVFTIIVSMISIGVFSGLYHSMGKFRSMLVSVFIVLMFHYLICDPVKFALLSIDAAVWPTEQHTFSTDKEAKHHSRLDYLKLRMRSLRGHIYITENHRDEKVNSNYKHIIHDLWLYGRYFVFVVCMVLVACDANAYYTKKNIDHLFTYNHTMYYGLNEVYDVSDIYKFIKSSLVNAFHPADNSTGSLSVWVHGKQTMLLGVVRLRQLRLTAQHYGMKMPPFSGDSFMPRWKSPYWDLLYSKIYWRIYEPWVPRRSHDFEKFLMNFNHEGYYRSYPELKGYVVLLARSRQNSLRVLEYLYDHKWLNYNTSALFIDFALYNTDASILSVCTLRVEQTPFGSTIPHVSVESVKLLENLNQLSDVAIILSMIYVIVFIQFFKALTVKLWFEPSEIHNAWNQIDIGIFLLNIILLTLIFIRERMVSTILQHIKFDNKMDFVELKHASRLHMIIRVLIGFLICITTLRLWKVLQFSTVFQLFTHTLHIAWKAVASVAIVICIFVMGFAVAASTINGNNSFHFFRLSKSIVSCMCFAFGFSVGVHPKDLFHGGKFLGIILFVILTFVIAVMLINVFVSLINDYFSTAKDQRDTRYVRCISIFQFFYAESAFFIEWWQRFRVFRKYYHRRERTVSEYIQHHLDMLDKYRQKSESVHTFDTKLKVAQTDMILENEQFRQQQERIYTTGALLNTQIDVLNTLLYLDNDS